MVFLTTADIKKTLEEYLIKHRIEHTVCGVVRVGAHGQTPDVLIKLSGWWRGVFVKGESSDVFTVFGQLVYQNKTISHLYLCSTKKFIERFKDAYSHSPPFGTLKKSLGFIVADQSSIKTIEHPQTKNYYFFMPEDKINKRKNNTSIGKTDGRERLDETDESILECLKEKGAATVWDIIKRQKFDLKYKNPYETINKRIKNLTNFGYIEIVNKHPKTISLVRK